MALFLLQDTAPKAGTPGVAQPQAGGGAGPQQQSQPGGMLTMLMPVLILIPFFFLMFRRQKKEQEQRSKLKKGDRVVSQSGLIGELVELDERVAKLKIAPGTTIQVLANTLGPFEPVKADATSKDLKDLKEAKAAADKK